MGLEFEYSIRTMTDEEKNKFLQLEAIRSIFPTKGKGVEIGAGSGLFASALGIAEGCDPSANMCEKAIGRGIKAIDGIAENLL